VSSPESLPPPADFIADTQVEPAGGGFYRCRLSDRWNAAVYPFGGVATAIALRAMQAELGGSQQRLRTATSLYVSPVPEGELEIRVEMLRRGRGMSHLQATLRAAGTSSGGLTQIAAYGQDGQGFAFVDLEPPDAPSPERAPAVEDPPPGWRRWKASFFEQLETRVVKMKPLWRTDWQGGGPAEAVRWMRFRRAPRLADGTLDPLALVALSDTMPPAINQKLGPTHTPFFAPSCDHTVHLYESTKHEWLLLRSRCRQAGSGYASCDMEIWSEDRRLLLYATQLMLVRFNMPEG
jgi:acyl-CoA thioesterase